MMGKVIRKIMYFIVFSVSLLTIFIACKKYNDMNQENLALALNLKANESLNLDEAIALLNQSVAIHKDQFAYEDLGDLYLIKGNNFLALKAYNNAIDLEHLKNKKANEILLAKKEILQNRIHHNVASGTFGKVVSELENKQKNNDSYVSLVILSKLYLSAGDTKKALTLLMQSKQYNDKDKFIDMMILEIKKRNAK
jgi:tetratricopeptide (TPR) repeat protein